MQIAAARVVGLDLSPESLRRARALAARAGAGIELVEANVYDARAVVTGSFDLVYTTLGVLCWLPDVEAWASVIASLLRPGGRLLLRDDHPVPWPWGTTPPTGSPSTSPISSSPSP